MKLITSIKNSAVHLCALVLLSFLSVQTFAQDKKVDISINSDKGSSNSYGQPWMWVVGGAVFILLLVLIIRGSGRRD